MKNFIKGRWFPLTIVILIVATVAIVMALFGWRITYAPELESSWDAISAVASWIGAIGTVAAVWFAVLSSNKQSKLSNKQQKQNTGLNLYPERRKALQLFAEKKYNEMYWDAVILFTPEISNGISKIEFYNQEHAKYCDLIDQYEMEMETQNPELYDEYSQLKCQEDSDLSNEIRNLCDQFKPLVDNPECGGKKRLDFRSLDENEKRTKRQSEALHLKIFQLMQTEIQRSIQ